MAQRFRATWLVAAIFFLPPAVAAQDLPLNAFFGKFSGSGLAQDADRLYFGVTVRDLDVSIEPKDSGFFVEWTSVIRAGGDPAERGPPGPYRAAILGDRDGCTCRNR